MARRWLALAALGSTLILGHEAGHARPGGLSGGDLGLGLMVGEPTGVSGQFNVSGPALGIAKLGTALNAAVGLDLLDDGDLYVHLDYILLVDNLVSGGSVNLPFYVGLGGFVVAKDNAKAGARVPFGLQLDFKSAPVHLFAEIVLRLKLIDDVDVGVAGALGFRYFF